MQFSEARRRASKMKLQSCTIVHISGLKAHIYDVVNDNGSFVSPLSVICLLFSHRPEPDQSSPDNAAWKLNRIWTADALSILFLSQI